MPVCAACGFSLEHNSFSKKEMRKSPAHRICTICHEAGVEATFSSDDDAGLRCGLVARSPELQRQFRARFTTSTCDIGECL